MAERGRPRGPDRIPFPLRVQKMILDAVKVSAAADLRSVNSQIEVLLREALKRRGLRIKQDDKDGGLTE
jgi:hypothetical protein